MADAAAIAALLARLTAAVDRDVVQALADADRQLAQARHAGDAEAVMLAQLGLGVVQHRAARYDLALATLRLAREAAERLRHAAAIAAARRAIGFVHEELGEYAPALAEYMHALAMDEASGNQASRALTLRTIGIVYSKAGDPAQGLLFYRESLALTRALGDDASSARTLNNIGINLKNLERLDEAQRALEDALAMFRHTGSKAGIAGVTTNLGLVALKRGELARAEALQREAIAVSQESGYLMGRVNGERGLAEALLAAGRTDEALAAAQAALATAEAMASRPEQSRCHRTLVDVFKARGDAAAALAHFERFHAIERQLFSEESDRRLRALQVGYQVQQLARQSGEDPLTGVANRRQLDARLAEELAEAQARGRALAVALIDIDDFKQVNDRHSHAMGDAVLRQIGALLRSLCRDADLAARYGGEEFALVMPATDADGAAVACEKLRAAVAGFGWSTLQPGLAITVSIGVADLQAVSAVSRSNDRGNARDLGHDVAALLAAADARLYEAKRSCKNRVCR